MNVDDIKQEYHFESVIAMWPATKHHAEYKCEDKPEGKKLTCHELRSRRLPHSGLRYA